MVKLTKQEKKAKKKAEKLAKLTNQLEVTKQLKRDELKKALQIQAVMRAQIDRTWRGIIEKIKNTQFINEIKAYWMSFERAHDAKGNFISHMLQLRQKAEDQHQLAITLCFDAIDTNIKAFLKNIGKLSIDYKEQVNAMHKQNNDDNIEIKRQQGMAETHLQLMLFHAGRNADAIAWAKRGKYMAKINDERSKNKDIYENLRSVHERALASVWDEYKEVIRKYMSYSTTNQKMVQFIRKKETKMTDIITRQELQMIENVKTISRLKRELFAYDSGSKLSKIREKLNNYREACKAIKKHVKQSNAMDRKKLELLVNCSDEVIDTLINLNNKCTKAMRYAAVCRKFQSQKEKILPRGENFDADEQIKNCLKQSVLKRSKKSLDCVINGNDVYIPNIESLMWRIGKVDLMTRALKREKQMLINENKLLLKKIKQQETLDNTKVPICKCSEKH